MGESEMDPCTLLNILHIAANLKTTTRHLMTEEDRAESVADHSWRLALFAMLLTGEPEFGDIDMNRVIRMCLIHDLGEAFTGDIPSFEKTDKDISSEDEQFYHWVDEFPEPQKEEWHALLKEIEALETREARLYKALDKLEAIISHDEYGTSTWLPLEYELQLTYGHENMQFSEYLTELRKHVDAWTRELIEQST